jgi:hypothetical protein
MLKKYIASKDTTITDAYGISKLSRNIYSNMGMADSLEVFANYNYIEEDLYESEKSRILLQFPIDSIILDRSLNKIPESGSVDFYFYLYNVEHPDTLPEKFTLVVSPISRSWDEGYGKDLDSYGDPGFGSQGLGANWIYSSSSSLGLVAWNSEGGDFYADPHYEHYFPIGTEDLRINITPLVEKWINGTIPNYGIGVYLTSSQEENPSRISFYTKKFSARNSEYFFSRPTIEAVWDSSIKDNRNNFHVSSSLVSEQDNTNTIYMYNYVRGVLKDPPLTTMYVRLFDSDGNEITTVEPNYPVTASKHSTGVLSASMIVDTTASVMYDRWYFNVADEHVFDGEIRIDSPGVSSINTQHEWEINLTNLKPIYSSQENPRLRLYSRRRNWHPNIYNQAIYEPTLHIIEECYYKVVRLADDLEVIAWGTGSYYTKLSYDMSGSYFDFDMRLLEPGYAYKFEFIIADGSSYDKHQNTFKFRVEEEIG